MIYLKVKYSGECNDCQSFSLYTSNFMIIDDRYCYRNWDTRSRFISLMENHEHLFFYNILA